MKFVYIIAPNENGPCKVGYASDVTKRLKGLQTGSPQRLAIFGIYPCDDAASGLDGSLAFRERLWNLHMCLLGFDAVTVRARNGKG